MSVWKLTQRQVALSAGCLLLATSTVMASDSESETPSWNGVYFGAELGAGNNRTPSHFTNANYFNTLGPDLLGTDFNFKTSGAVGGVYAGYSAQTGPWVMGVEGSFVDVDLREGMQSSIYPTDHYTANVDYYATGKVRLGLSYRQWLAYVNGGLAGGNLTLSLVDRPGAVSADSKKWSNGWVTGFGVEYRLTESIALGGTYDYLRLHLKHQSLSCPSCGTGSGFGSPMVDSRVKTQMVMARINYFIDV